MLGAEVCHHRNVMCMFFYLWWHISVITCQILISTCQMFMLTCQFIMSTRQKNHHITSRHNFWQVDILIRQVAKLLSDLFKQLCWLVRCSVNLSDNFVVWYLLGTSTLLRFIIWQMNKWKINTKNKENLYLCIFFKSIYCFNDL